MSKLLKPREAADRLNIVPRTLRNHSVPNGTIPVVRIGRCVRYSEAALDQWVKDNAEETTSNNQEVASCQ